MTASGADRGRGAGPAQAAATRAAGKAGAAGRSYRPPRPAAARPARPRRPAERSPSRIIALAVTGILILVTASVARIANVGASAVSPQLAWTLSPASNTVTIRLTAASGPSGRRIPARSRLVVSEDGQRTRQSPDGGTVRIPVPPGEQTSLVVQVEGPRPGRQALTVTVPPRCGSSHRGVDPAGSCCRCRVRCAVRTGRCAARTRSATRDRRKRPGLPALVRAGPS